MTAHAGQRTCPLIRRISLRNTASSSVSLLNFVEKNTEQPACAADMLIGRPFYLRTHKELIYEGRATTLHQGGWQKVDLSATDLMNHGRAISDGQGTGESHIYFEAGKLGFFYFPARAHTHTHT